VIDWALERDLERSFEAARATRERIARHVRVTPLLDCEGPTQRALKLECLQRTGSFKVRGAAAALSAGERPHAVIAASTGNHGLAVAALAGTLRLPCRVFVPATAAPAKLALLAASGAELTRVAGDPLEAELAAREAADAAGALLVAPYNDPQVILGQATIGLELLEQVPLAPDALFVAVGGGGLISGVALALRERWAQTRIVGCVAAASPALADAVGAGRAIDSRLEPTLADASAGNIEADSITIAAAAALVDRFELIEEDEIAAAMRAALLEHHLVIEGASALALAGSLRSQAADGARHVVVLGGGNVGADTLRAILG
jgi:threonine dehydratase